MQDIKTLSKCCFGIMPIPTQFGWELSYEEQVCVLKQKMNEIITAINDNLETFIREQLNLLYINAMYDAETETLLLYLEVKDNA